MIETDFMMPSFSNLYLEQQPDIFFNDYLNGRMKFEDVIYTFDHIAYDIIFADRQFIPSDKVHSSDRGWFLVMRDQLYSDLKKTDYDIVIFDLAPGISFFTLTILTIADRLFAIVRPDHQSFQGTLHLLENFYKRAINSLQVKFHVIFNQVPNYDPVYSLLDEWIHIMKSKYPYLLSFENIPYDPQTAYLAAINQAQLPETNSSFIKIKDLLDKIY